MFALTLMLLGCIGKDLPPPPDAPSETDATVDETDTETSQTDSDPQTNDTDTTDTDAVTDDTDTTPTDDSGDSTTEEEDPLFPLKGDCDFPDEWSDDPIRLDSELRSEDVGLFMEALDVSVSWLDEIAYVVGQGGFMMFDLSGTVPALLDQFRNERERYYKIAPLGGGWFAAAHRDLTVDIMDASSGASVSRDNIISLSGGSALAAQGDYLYVGTVDGSVITYNVSSPAAPSEVDRLGGLDTVWDLAIDGDWMYAADNALGVVAIDLSDPAAPSLGAAASTTAAAQAIDVENGYAYVAVGSSGVEVFDLSTPGAPVAGALIGYGSAVIDIDVDDGLVWAVNHEDVLVIDVADPENPRMIGSEQTEEWAMCVAASGEQAFVGDWGTVQLYSVDRDVYSPESDPSRSDIHFYTDDESSEFTIANRGSATLELLGASSTDSRLTVHSDITSVAPGEEAQLRIDFTTPGETLKANVCIATNDPDNPLEDIAVASRSYTGSSVAVGESAIDFSLTDTDGVTHRLSDYIGKTVVLVYFATW